MRTFLFTAAVLALVAFAPFARAGNIEPTHISLPSGPGSIEGLGRSFAPSLASGTASYGVDIAVPPSSGGFAPHLSLDYDSAGGVTSLGMGWRLSGIPTIRRRTENGLPRFTDADPLEITGMGIPCDLLETSPGTFRPEYESGAFVRVQKAGADTWEAREKSGVTWNFGGGAVFEEAEGTNVATYLPSASIDAHGHRIAFAWDTSSGYALLEGVVWNDFGDGARNEVLFAYEARPDVHALYDNGIKQTVWQRMTAIEVRHGGALVRRYELAYGQDIHSRLASIALVGRDGSSRLPALSLAYTPQTVQPQLVAMTTPPGRTPSDPNVELTDLDGDGLPDLLVTGAATGQYRSYVNQDGQSWQPGVDWDIAQSPSVALGQTGVQLADLDGDGAIDLVAKSGTDDFRYFPGNTATSFRAPVPIATVPNFTFEDPDVKLADMDGDRRIDTVITTADGLAIGYNLDGVDWTEPQVIGQVDPNQALRFSDGGHTQLCDVNGDRVEDLCYLTPGSLVYWLGRGRGVFEGAQAATGVPSWDPTSPPWELHDLDGDGWVDLVHVGVDEVDVALATAAGQFGAPQAITTVPETNPSTVALRFADMDANGSLDIVWIDVSGGAAQAWQYLELFPAGRAGLLAHVDNGLGKVTSITYAPAALDAAAARAANTPWTSRVNVPMSVVHEVDVDDSLGDPTMVTQYAYQNGTWSPAERTFAGFAGGSETDVGDATTPTLLTTSTFDVGLDDRTLRGVVLTTGTQDTTGVLFARTTTTWTTNAIDTGMDGRTVNYSYKTSEQTDSIEGTDASKARTTLVEYKEDSYGDVTSESHWGEVVAGDKLAGHDEAITTRTFANDAQDWLLGRVATEELDDAAGNRARMKRTYYDGLPLGQVARGDVTRQEEWVGPDPSAFDLVVATSYDADGNPTETTDARGGGSLFTWDPSDRTTLLAESRKLDGGRQLTQTAVTDRAFGALLAVTGYNGQTTAVTYDAFGRVTALVRPGDSADRPTVSYAYDEAAPLSRVTTSKRTWPGRDDVETGVSVVDGLARSRATFATAADGRLVLAGVQLLDARGQGRRSLRPRFVDPSALTSPPLHVDADGDNVWRDATGRTIRTQSQLGIETRTAFAPFVDQRWDGAQSDPSSPYEHAPVTDSRDGLGRLVAHADVLQGAPLAATFAYDAAGDLVSKTDPEGHAATYAYDGRGRRVLVVDPDAGRHAFVFDATGDLLEHDHPDVAAERFTYDLAGRTLTEDWDGDGAPEVVNTWDGDAASAGVLARVTDPSGGATYDYDERQRVIAAHVTVASSAGAATYTTASAFDSQDREYWHQFPDGSSVAVLRDSRGIISGYGAAVTITSDADGAELARAFNTGVTQTTTYDGDRRPLEKKATAADGTPRLDLTWAYDGAGNILSVTDGRPGVAPDQSRSETYAYDNLYRLTGAAGAWGSASWGYSPSGNLVQRTSTVAGLNAGTIGYGAGAGPHALTQFQGRTVRYDARGRMTDDGDRQYAWDGADHLTHVTRADGSAVDSAFEAGGARRARHERFADGHASDTIFLDAWSEVQDGKLVRYLVHGGRRFARLADGVVAGPSGGCNASAEPPGGVAIIAIVLMAALVVRSRRRVALAVACAARAMALAMIRRVHRRKRRPRTTGRIPLYRLAHSWLGRALAAVMTAVLVLTFTGCTRSGGGPTPIREGTVQALGVEDELLFDDAIGSLAEETTGAGAPAGSFAAYPYGLTRFDTAAAVRKYAGTPRDTGIGLDQMGARSYAPDLGVWTSADPLALTSPEHGLRASFAANNPYTYAGDSPVVGVDRDGHFVILIVAIIIGVLVTSQYANAPEHEDTPLLHKSDPDLALDAAHNSAMVYGALATGAGAVTTIGAEGLVAGGVKVGSQLAQGAIAGEAVHQVTDAVDPSGRLGEAADIAMVVQSTAPTEGLAARAGPQPLKKPAEPYNRRSHYGRTPSKADRKTFGAGPDEVVDHNPPLVRRYYEGDPARGEKPGYQMTPDERAASGSDRSRMQLQPRTESNSQGGTMSQYSQQQKEKNGL